ncbi:alpha/beta-hydrolase [Aspergillus steynii IBT 23096]|uniref:Alpha/beta-hydrolase n=1 Tax=Aspergillus steynii IBT 23096 TaxID=1392250 RepID=A0A2I2G8U3_9EURO|nr:alpha/beta-hydrolase [Aspergillus steynii IBT 23096]PLB49305.1 alpha/beta-hydrolase [Aspergillus steynii IBT 23096]
MARNNRLRASLPFKLLFILHFLPVASLRLLFYIVFYAFRFSRPRWPYRRCISVEIIKLSVELVYGIDYKAKLSLNPDKEGDQFIRIKPRLDCVYKDILDSAEIKPAIVGAIWYPTRYSNADTTQKIVLHFHGGGYIICDAREDDCGPSARSLSRQFDDAPVLCLDYRLANTPNGRFPAAIQDAVTAYRYLIEDMNIDSSRLILSGDSAGGNLVLALLRYLSDNPDVLPLPNAALLWSAWVNLSDMSHVARSVNRGIDCLNATFLEWAVDVLTDDGRIVPSSHPYLSFAQSPFYVKVPIWAMVGTAESFYESNAKFVREMRAFGNVVMLYEMLDAPHDVFMASRAYGLEREVEKAMREVWGIIQKGAW